MLDILKSAKEEKYIQNIIEVYEKYENPFVIAFSGGKDSTYLLHLFFEALKRVKDYKNKLYIITSDTMVEEPKGDLSIELYFEKIVEYAKLNGFSSIIETVIVKPRLEQRYFSKLIGKGYSIPVNNFRWCTTDLKIDPINNFIRSLSENKDIIVTTGTRKEESTSREELLSTFDDNNISLKKLNERIINFSPIMDATVGDIWNYLLKKDDEFWLDLNSELYESYTVGETECPLIISDDDLENTNARGGCGSSRFGCWTCTLISNKTKTSMEKNAELNNNKVIHDLSMFRYKLLEYRTNDLMREIIKRDGVIPIVRNAKPITNKGVMALKVNVRSHQRETYIPIEKLQIDVENSHKNSYGYYIFDSESVAKNYILENKLYLVNEENIEIINKLYIKDGNNYSKIGRGPFNFEGRRKMLIELFSLNLAMQKEQKYFDTYVIEKDEVDYIFNTWLEEGMDRAIIIDNFANVYNELYGSDLNNVLFEQISEIDNMISLTNLLSNKRDHQKLQKEVRNILMEYKK